MRPCLCSCSYTNTLLTLQYCLFLACATVSNGQVCVLFVYFIDTLLKVLVYGVVNFWAHLQFRFELIVSIISSAVAIYSIAAPAADTATGAVCCRSLFLPHCVVHRKLSTLVSDCTA
jgi:hypothetical protein